VTELVLGRVVSRETEARLAAFESEFLKWAARINLVAPSTMKDVRQRHIADSAQILDLAPEAKTIIDLGSGGGFPGLVLAILLAETPESRVHLVESNGKKCAFLRHIVRTLSLNATVHNDRIEDVINTLRKPDIVTARALAPLPLLLQLALPQLSKNVPGFFHKGRDHAHEIAAARGEFNFDLLVHPSRVDSGSVILEIRNVVSLAA
jgi:16S rRNA (guanine527-N7)-methyltransferase